MLLLVIFDGQVEIGARIIRLMKENLFPKGIGVFPVIVPVEGHERKKCRDQNKADKGASRQCKPGPLTPALSPWEGERESISRCSGEERRCFLRMIKNADGE